MYQLLGVSLALAGLLTANALASVVASIVWHAIERYAAGWSAVVRARVIFALRVYPIAMSLLVVSAIIAPAYFLYEPAHTGEDVGPGLALLAFISASGVLLALWRGLSAFLATNRLVRLWKQAGEPLKHAGLPVPAFQLKHQFPVVSLVGIFRPKLFVSSLVLETLTPGELSTAIAHEFGHLLSRDNLKRSVLRACRDVLTILPSGRALDRAWAQAAEEAADERAADGHPASAVDLASALIKIARLVPPGGRPTMPAGAYLIGEFEAGAISGRVQRLLGLSDQQQSPSRFHGHAASLLIWVAVISSLIAIAGVSSTPGALRGTHSAIEWVVGIFS
jgi:Zn-dependent protease with chaperone function